MPTALITGASSGIGAALTRHLLSLNWNVIMVARRENLMSKISSDFPSKTQNKICVIKADLTDENDCTMACKKALKFCDNKLNLLVNNAGGGGYGTTQQCSIKDWKQCIDLNLTAPFIMTKYMLPALKSVQGCVINISSTMGSTTLPEGTAYCVAKAGLEHLTRNNAVEFGGKKVRVNCIAPDMVIVGKRDKEYNKKNSEYFPLKRLGTVNDIINCVMFLCDNMKSGWINGQIITMDGGKNNQWIGSKM